MSDDRADGEQVAREDGPGDRSRGPFDRSDVSDDEAGSMLDLGALLIPAREGMDIQVQVDEASGQVSAVTLVVGDGAVQVQAYAAPKTAGIWDQVRRSLAGSIGSSGGVVDEAKGEFGPELRAKVPQGDGAPQPARFVGVDGPRWFLRGVLLGAAAVPGAGHPAEDAFRAIVVVRGSDAMAPGDPIPLVLPTTDSAATPVSRPRLNPFQRGPEITEVR